MNEAKIMELAEDVAGLKVSVSSIEGKIDSLFKALMGNGKPGMIADLQTRDSELSARQDKFENKIQWLTGIWIGSSGVIVILFTLLELFLRK